jgi:hypothetical protein
MCSRTDAGVRRGLPVVKGGAGSYSSEMRRRRLAPGHLGRDGRREIYARRHSPAGEDVAVAHDACLSVDDANERQ